MDGKEKERYKDREKQHTTKRVNRKEEERQETQINKIQIEYGIERERKRDNERLRETTHR